MLIRSQDKETLINFNNSIVVNTMVDIGGVTKLEFAGCTEKWRIFYFRKIFHKRKSHESTGYDSGSLWRFGIHKICNSRSM